MIEIDSRFGDWDRGFRRRLRDAHDDTGRTARAVAVANCPVSDGEFKPEGQKHLVETIDDHTERNRDGYSTEVTAGDPDEGVDYPDFVENGTGVHREGGGGRTTPWVYTPNGTAFFVTTGSEAQPFMTPAYDAARPLFKAGCLEAARG